MSTVNKLPEGMELTLRFGDYSTLGAVRAFMGALESLPDDHEILIAPVAPDSNSDCLYVVVEH